MELKTEKNYFIKSIGYGRTASGGLRAKTWYLGKVEDGERAARREADRIADAWQAVKASGGSEWTQEAIAALQKNPDAPAGTPAPKAGSGQTIEQVSRLYIDAMQDRCDKKQITQEHVNGEEAKIAKATKIIGKDITMAKLDAEKLTAAVLSICARPLTEQPNHKMQKQMSFVSAREYKKSFKSFLNWAATTPIEGTTDKPLWLKPLSFDRIFSDNSPVMLAADRQAALQKMNGDEVTTFTLEELAPLYVSTRFQTYGRLFMLLGLNCGFANEEIADLKPYEIVKGASPFIHRFRGKTETPDSVGIYAKWPLWDETYDLLKSRMQKDGDMALVTPEGRRLIVGRADYVASVWRILQKYNLDTAGRKLSFKYLRKTAAKMIQNDLGYGPHIADAFLSHGGRGVLAKYTPQDWERVAEAVGKLRIHLQGMFDALDAHRAKEVEVAITAQRKTA